MEEVGNEEDDDSNDNDEASDDEEEEDESSEESSSDDSDEEEISPKERAYARITASYSSCSHIITIFFFHPSVLSSSTPLFHHSTLPTPPSLSLQFLYFTLLFFHAHFHIHFTPISVLSSNLTQVLEYCTKPLNFHSKSQLWSLSLVELTASYRWSYDMIIFPCIPEFTRTMSIANHWIKTGLYSLYSVKCNVYTATLHFFI